MQVFDSSKQKQYPVTNRYIQTILGQPKTLQIYGSQLQPPKQAYCYSEKGENKWGEGPSPTAPITHLFAQPWSGQSTARHHLAASNPDASLSDSGSTLDEVFTVPTAT